MARMVDRRGTKACTEDDYYLWEWHLPGTKHLISELLFGGLDEITEDSLVHFLRPFVDYFPSDGSV